MIPFNKPVYLGTELEAIRRALEDNGHAAGGGPFGRACEAELERMLGARTLLVTSGTHALELAAHLVGAGPGDEVILPSFTFVSTANAFVLRGARPVFVDVDENGNIDPREVAERISSRVKAVVPVHYAGSSCDMGLLAEAAGAVPIIEDAAQALGSTHAGRPLGTFGACGAFSFHETKNLGCGEGGALAVRDASLVERAEYFRDKGTNRRQFLDGLVDKYTWVDLGSSFVLSDINAAYLSVQLAERERIQARRRQVWERYDEALSGPAARIGAHVVRPQAKGSPNHHLFALVFASPEHRARYIAHMKGHGIVTPFHYVALHLSPMGRRFHDGRPLPATERLSSCLVRLPLFFNMTDADVDEVVDRTLELFRAL